jgi:hypothetical protein
VRKYDQLLSWIGFWISGKNEIVHAFAWLGILYAYGFAHRDGSDTKWVVCLIVIHLYVNVITSRFKLKHNYYTYSQTSMIVLHFYPNTTTGYLKSTVLTVKFDMQFYGSFMFWNWIASYYSCSGDHGSFTQNYFVFADVWNVIYMLCV